MDELESGVKYLTTRYPELDKTIIRNAVYEQFEAGDPIKDCILFVRLACSLASHRRETFVLPEVAAVLGLSVEEAVDALKARGLHGALISPAPWVEKWLGG